jgi:hypothetical protein
MNLIKLVEIENELDLNVQSNLLFVIFNKGE